MLHRHVGRHELDDLGVDLEAREIHRRHAILPGERLRDLGLLDEAELHETIAQPGARGALLRERLIQLLPRDQPFADKKVA